MKRLMVIAGMVVLLGSCYNDKYDKLYPVPTVTTTCDTTLIKYSTDIKPIMDASCAISGGCHDAAGNANTGGLDYTQISVLQGSVTQAAIIGDINGTPTSRNHAMPLNLPKLSTCDIKKITRWVNEGAPNN